MFDQRDIEDIIDSHRRFPQKPSKAFRKWDGKTPYDIHPLWCATTILTETTLEEQLRKDGSQALLYHDVFEDTTSLIGQWVSANVRRYIRDMTFEGGSKQEMIEIWNKPSEIQLLKLYDKVSNLLDGSWMSQEKRQDYENYTRKLCDKVLEKYGKLNITKIARGILHE